MPDFAFYHIEGDTPAALDAVLPPLLEKMMAAGHKVCLCVPTLARAQRLSEYLWVYEDAAFLPHDLWADGVEKERQPLVLLDVEGRDDAALQLALEGRLPLVLAGAETVLPLLEQADGRVLYVFSAQDALLQVARGLWKGLKAKGFSLVYWQQVKGRWEKKG